MASYHRDFDAALQADLAAALGHESWADVPEPVRLNLRARETNLDEFLER